MRYFALMTDLQERINAFAELGNRLESLDQEVFTTWVARASAQNKWFTEREIRLAISNIRKMLNADLLSSWVSNYSFSQKSPQRIGLVLAGNIPMVGFHDLLSVLISGNIAVVKLSSQDSVLLESVFQLLIEIEPRMASQFEVAEKITQADAYIATGSDNTARYFEYYFAKKPHIIRKNRTSIAVLNGKESEDDLRVLGDDMFTYFGLGCRNVSKVFLPTGFDPVTLIKNLESFSYLVDHTKFGNNYEYNRAIYLLKCVQYFDNGFFLLKEDEGLVSPISVVYYEYYNSLPELQTRLAEYKEKIQVVTSLGAWFEGSLPFGTAQEPSLTDYADNIDTMAFLEKL